MANSKRKCGYCGDRFPTETMVIKGAQAFCTKEHWIENQVKNKDALIAKGQNMQKQARRKEEIEAEKEARAERKRLKQRKEALRPLKWYEDKAQEWVNKFIRLRDRLLPCISCGKETRKGGYVGAGGLHAGHYRSRGACSFLRFHEDNIHGQCAQCNEQLSGNAIEFRIALVKKIGTDRVEWLEQQPKSRKWTREELDGITTEYKAKCKQLEAKINEC